MKKMRQIAAGCRHENVEREKVELDIPESNMGLSRNWSLLGDWMEGKDKKLPATDFDSGRI
jgi:hypothetical protein